MKQRLLFASSLSLLALFLGGCACCFHSKESRFTTLFDGSSLAQWRGYKQDSFPSNSWKIDQGALHAIGGAPSVDVISRYEYGDFELTFDWKVAPGANSGVIYRVSEERDASFETGPEYQILDDARHADGKDPRTSAAALYALLAPNDSKMLKPVGDWNEARIRVEKGHVEHWLNGKRVLAYEWASPEIKGLIAKSKFNTMPAFMTKDRGHVVFQHHGDNVWYRNIRIRSL